MNREYFILNLRVLVFVPQFMKIMEYKTVEVKCVDEMVSQ